MSLERFAKHFTWSNKPQQLMPNKHVADKRGAKERIVRWYPTGPKSSGRLTCQSNLTMFRPWGKDGPEEYEDKKGNAIADWKQFLESPESAYMDQTGNPYLRESYLDELTFVAPPANERSRTVTPEPCVTEEDPGNPHMHRDSLQELPDIPIQNDKK